MSIHKEDVKHSIDSAAEKLKEITDTFAAKLNEAGDEASRKAREMARKTGDMMIEQGHRLKEAAREPIAPAHEV